MAAKVDKAWAEHALAALQEAGYKRGGARTAVRRQQTLRATIDWSHDLLSDEDRAVFRRLSVFAGGCSLEAAEEVAEADLDILQSLVEKSLVRHSEERYWMFETIREYAAERLGEARVARDPFDHLAVDDAEEQRGPGGYGEDERGAAEGHRPVADDARDLRHRVLMGVGAPLAAGACHRPSASDSNDAICPTSGR